MDVTVNDLMFTFGFLAALTIIFICWIIYRYYKWVEKVKDKLSDHQWKLTVAEENIDRLNARVKVLEKVDSYHRVKNTSHNEEGIGSINPSEADTE